MPKDGGLMKGTAMSLQYGDDAESCRRSKWNRRGRQRKSEYRTMHLVRFPWNGVCTRTEGQRSEKTHSISSDILRVTFDL